MRKFIQFFFILVLVVLTVLAYATTHYNFTATTSITTHFAGYALLLLGTLFMLIEVLISCFGVLGIVGIMAFIVGIIMLSGIDSPDYAITWLFIMITTIFSTLFFLLLIRLTLISRRKKIVSGQEALIGSIGEVIEFNKNDGLIRIQGELWQAFSDTPLEIGQKVRVVQLTGLVVTVKPITSTSD